MIKHNLKINGDNNLRMAKHISTAIKFKPSDNFWVQVFCYFLKVMLSMLQNKTFLYFVPLLDPSNTETLHVDQSRTSARLVGDTNWRRGIRIGVEKERGGQRRQ
jgi:hypothetical protein